MGAEPPILEFLRIVRRTSDFGVLNIINNILKTTQNLRFLSFCVEYADPPILEVLRRAQNLQNRSNFIPQARESLENLIRKWKKGVIGSYWVWTKEKWGHWM